MFFFSLCCIHTPFWRWLYPIPSCSSIFSPDLYFTRLFPHFSMDCPPLYSLRLASLRIALFIFSIRISFYFLLFPTRLPLPLMVSYFTVTFYRIFFPFLGIHILGNSFSIFIFLFLCPFLVTPFIRARGGNRPVHTPSLGHAAGPVTTKRSNRPTANSSQFTSSRKRLCTRYQHIAIILPRILIQFL